MPLARMMLSSAQRCSAKRLVIAPPSASAQAALRAATSAAAPVPAAAMERMKRRRSMARPPEFFRWLIVRHRATDAPAEVCRLLAAEIDRGGVGAAHQDADPLVRTRPIPSRQ